MFNLGFTVWFAALEQSPEYVLWYDATWEQMKEHFIRLVNNLKG